MEYLRGLQANIFTAHFDPGYHVELQCYSIESNADIGGAIALFATARTGTQPGPSLTDLEGLHYQARSDHSHPDAIPVGVALYKRAHHLRQIEEQLDRRGAAISGDTLALLAGEWLDSRWRPLAQPVHGGSWNISGLFEWSGGSPNRTSGLYAKRSIEGPENESWGTVTRENFEILLTREARIECRHNGKASVQFQEVISFLESRSETFSFLFTRRSSTRSKERLWVKTTDSWELALEGERQWIMSGHASWSDAKPDNEGEKEELNRRLRTARDQSIFSRVCLTPKMRMSLDGVEVTQSIFGIDGHGTVASRRWVRNNNASFNMLDSQAVRQGDDEIKRLVTTSRLPQYVICYSDRDQPTK